MMPSLESFPYTSKSVVPHPALSVMKAEWRKGLSQIRRALGKVALSFHVAKGTEGVRVLHTQGGEEA